MKYDFLFFIFLRSDFFGKELCIDGNIIMKKINLQEKKEMIKIWIIVTMNDKRKNRLILM